MADASELMRAIVVMIAFSVVAIGCAPEASEPPRVAARDSAGITIVENIGPAWQEGEGWRLSSEPVVRIGEVEGANEYLLVQAMSALRFDDGTIVVANAGTEELRFYDGEGRYLRTAGRRGGGPGEFQNLVWIYRLGADTIVAWDDNPPRVAFINKNGTFGRSVRPEELGVLRGAFPDGSLLLAEHHDWSQRPADGRIRMPARAYRLDSQGMIADSLPVFPGREFDFRTSERSVGLAPPPFGRRTVFAVAGDGFYVGSQDDFQVDYYDRHGALKKIVRWPARDRLVAPEDLEAYRHYELDEIESENMRRRAEEIIDGQTYPEEFPAFGAIAVDPDGNLWIEEYHRDWDPTRSWIVFDAAQRMLGRVEMPGDFIVHQVGSDFVLGWAWDELDVEYALLYELTKQRTEE
jgi:hypothetical protein